VKDCVTCDEPETNWPASDPLYTCGAHKCPYCIRADLNEQATRKNTEK
jgi:hypothetical protein